MERDDIIGGLKSALARGDSLDNAMRSFINAGYKREDVESASRLLNQQPQQIQSQQTQQPMNTIPQATRSTYAKPAAISPPVNMQKQSYPVQRVSSYEKPKSKFGLVIVILLLFVLLALIGVLVGVVFFRENIANVINGLFGNG